MGRWERTHQALIAAAVELFTQHGYDNTRTAQIAARAGVSEMTLFRHFPTKEALLLEDPFDPLMAELVRTRPADEHPMRALAEGIRQAWGQIDDADKENLRTRLNIIQRTPSLSGAIERNSQDTIVALTHALTQRGVDNQQAQVAAAAVLTGLSTALLSWASSDGLSLHAAVNSALDVVGGG